eukprot:scaffold8519_cov277-Pinguiococcus_pyrenoidosus.AAC.5
MERKRPRRAFSTSGAALMRPHDYEQVARYLLHTSIRERCRCPMNILRKRAGGGRMACTAVPEVPASPGLNFRGVWPSDQGDELEVRVSSPIV